MRVTGRDEAGAPRELADPCGEAPLPDKVLFAKPTDPSKLMPRAALHPSGWGIAAAAEPGPTTSCVGDLLPTSPRRQ